jgi:DNA-binding beta-propeller fold protein YncE
LLRAHFTRDTIYVIDTETNEIIATLNPANEEDRLRAIAINAALIEAWR